MTQNNLSAILTGIVIAICFYLFNIAVPYYSDDWWYNFIHEADYSYPTERIDEVGDIVTSQVNHYQTVNGRMPVTALVQYIVSFIPKSIFNILNTVIFSIAILLLIRCFTSLRIGTWHMVVAAWALFFIMPGHYDTMMWATGAINYLWVGTLILCVLLLWKHLDHATLPVWLGVPLFAIGCLAGWSNEALSFGLAAGIGIEAILRRKELTAQHLALGAGIMVGAGMILLAPGSWNRMGGIYWNNIGIQYFIPMIGGLLIPCALAVALFLLYRHNHRQFRSFITQYRIWLIASACLIPVCLLTYQCNARSFYGTALYALVPLLALINNYTYDYIRANRSKRYIMYALACLMTIGLGIEHAHVEKQHRTLIELYSHDDDGVIALDSYHRAWYATPFTLDVDKKYHRGAIPRHMAAYYGKDSLQWLSVALYEQLTHPQDFFVPANKMSGDKELYTTDDIDCYILAPGGTMTDSLLFHYAPVSVHDDVPITSKMRRLIAPESYEPQAVLPNWHGEIQFKEYSYTYITKSKYRKETAIDYYHNEK